jgi:hypothetical protein
MDYSLPGSSRTRSAPTNSRLSRPGTAPAAQERMQADLVQALAPRSVSIPT